jgi:putative transposase
MARMARLKFSGEAGFYHLCARTAGFKGSYPLADPLCQFKLTELLKQLSSVWCCQVAGFSVMGNHYHTVASFDEFRKLGKKELFRRALLLYPGQKAMLKGWLSHQWDRFHERIFDLSEFMRTLQSNFARWYNKSFNRQGRFWADRFKSTLLGNQRAVLDCLLYVELNSVRAGLVTRPEEYKSSSIYRHRKYHNNVASMKGARVI